MREYPTEAEIAARNERIKEMGRGNAKPSPGRHTFFVTVEPTGEQVRVSVAVDGATGVKTFHAVSSDRVFVQHPHRQLAVQEVFHEDEAPNED